MQGGYVYVKLMDGKTLKCYTENYEEHAHCVYLRIDGEHVAIPWHQIKEIRIK